jgi:hypothetical protein
MYTCMPTSVFFDDCTKNVVSTLYKGAAYNHVYVVEILSHFGPRARNLFFESGLYCLNAGYSMHKFDMFRR